jgi:tRNA1Val (adenine37-N6)-methyltransferase
VIGNTRDYPPDVETDVPVGCGFTTDTLLRGRVTLLQPLRGFRSSLDPVLLAAFARRPFGRFVDIGCGTGALSFLLAARDETATGVGVEIQPRLASLASAGLAPNRFADRIQILHADVRAALGRPPLHRRAFDLVVTNPPYRPVPSGVLSPHPERAQANHEVTLTLDEWLGVATDLVRPGGRVAVIFPAERLEALIAGLQSRSLSPARVRLVHPRSARPASRVLVEAVAGARQTLTKEPALILHEADGAYTREIQTMLGEDNPAPDRAREHSDQAR